MPENPDELVAAAVADLLVKLAGLTAPVQWCGELGGVTCAIQVSPARSPPPARKVRAAAGEERAQCRRDIVDTIRAVGHALTRKQLVAEMKRAGTPHGAGTVAKALAELTKAGELVNRKDKHGYRLPEWPKKDETPSLFD